MEQSLLDLISLKYNLSTLLFLGEPEHGLITKNSIVSDENGTQYFIKNFRASDLERLACIEQTAVFVATHSTLPVVLPLPNNEGEFHTVINDTAVSLYPFIVSEKYIPQSPEQEIEYKSILGATLGMIHGASRGQDVPDSILSSAVYSPSNSTEASTVLERIKSHILQKNERDEYDEKALSFIILKLSLLENGLFEDIPGREKVVCHGDFHSGNLLFNNDGEVIGICDWDHAGQSSPYNDFLRAFSFCVIRDNFKGYHEHLNHSKAFIQGYLGNGGFFFDESDIKRAIDVWYQKVVTSSWPMSDHYDLFHTKTDHIIDKRLQELLFLKDNSGALLKHILSCID